MSNIYCPICGIILLYNDFEYPIPSTRQRPWFAEIRAVYQSEARPCHLSITGVGFLDSRNILLAPLNNDLSYKDTEALDVLTLLQNQGRCWGYGFHNSCWKLLRARLPHIKEDSDILETIFSLLLTTPCPDLSSFQFNHDYGGAMETQKIRGRPKPINLASPLYADPCAIPSPTTLESFALDKASFPSRKQKTARLGPLTGSTSGLGHLLGRLPAEIIYEILSYLPLVGVSGLRLVCRELALIAECDNLPQSFWRSRFVLGHEQDYIFPDFTVARDWSQLFHGARSCFMGGNKSLANRMRIRRLLEPIAVLVELNTTKARIPFGLPISSVGSDEEQQWLLDNGNGEDLPVNFESIRFFTGQLASRDHDDQLTQGCRAQQYRIARFPSTILEISCNENIRRLKVSTVHIGSQCYISGIRYFYSEDSPLLGSFPLELGLRAPSGENQINIPPGVSVKSVEVAFCASGLVGIRFVFTGNEDGSSKWIGQCGGQGIAHGSFQLPKGEPEYYFVAGLDAYKIVALGLVRPNRAGGRAMASSLGDGLVPNFTQSHIWIPRVPTHENLAINALEPFKRPPAFQPLIDIDFGGCHGILLSSLTRIVVHMVSDFCPIIGIDVFYTDRCMRFGSGGGTELSFFINGPEGERITSMEITVNGSEYGVCGLQISTNYGRSMVFTTLRHFFNSSKTKLCQRPQGDNVITGFVATLAETGAHFVQLGLQSQSSTREIITQPSNIKEGAQCLSDDEMKYDLEFAVCIRTKGVGEYQTCASLDGLKRIAASTGSPRRSRSSRNIAGLRFDYHDQRSPTVIGQWMDEHDAIYLAQGETLQGFTIWLTKEGEFSLVRGLKQGRVVAIQVDTSSGQHKIFQPHGAKPTLHGCIKHQYQSGPQENITAISWVLNSCFDRVRVIASIKLPKNPVLIPDQAIPFDQVQRFFFQQILEDGSKDKLKCIVAYFTDQTVSGLRFVYESNQSRSIGNTDTVQHQAVDVGADEIISFSVAIRESEIVELEFQVGSDQGTPGILRTYKLRAPNNSSDSSQFLYDFQDTWCTSELSARHVVPIGRDRKYYPPPGAKFVGIYVSCEQLSLLGALFSRST